MRSDEDLLLREVPARSKDFATKSDDLVGVMDTPESIRGPQPILRTTNHRLEPGIRAASRSGPDRYSARDAAGAAELTNARGGVSCRSIVSAVPLSAVLRRTAHMGAINMRLKYYSSLLTIPSMLDNIFRKPRMS